MGRLMAAADVQMQPVPLPAQLVEGQDQVVDPFARVQLAERADVAAERLGLRRELAQRDGRPRRHDLMGLVREAGHKLRLLAPADDDHLVHRVPVDAIRPLVELVPVQPRDDAPVLGQP